MANPTANDHRAVLKRVLHDSSTELDLKLAINFILAALDSHISANARLVSKVEEFESAVEELKCELIPLRILDRHID